MENEEVKKVDGFVPMELRGGWETFKNLPNRVVTLIWKLLGWKGVIVGLTVWMVLADKITEGAIPYVWISIALIVIFDKDALKIIKDIKR